MTTTENLNVTLPVGYVVGGSYTREVQILKSNAITEEVATRKLQDNPYTWMGNILSVFLGKIGNTEVAPAVRKNYLDTGDVIIPDVIKSMPLADVNTMLLEIHRKAWSNVIPNQKIICRQCGKNLTADIDLNKIPAPELATQYIAENAEILYLYVELDTPLDLKLHTKKMTKEEDDVELAEAAEYQYNRLVFRVPTLRDMIKNEKHVSRNIDFWRLVTLDTLFAIQATRTEENGNVTVMEEYPLMKVTSLGLKFFHLFDGADLRKIRHTLIEDLPTMPFMYEEVCPCDMRKTIPFAMEATSFFSE